MLTGGSSKDRLYGGPGNDTIYSVEPSGLSDRVIDCGSGYDVVSGDPNDRKRSRIRNCERFDVGQAPPSAATQGVQRINKGNSFRLVGTGLDDTLLGNAGRDVLVGMAARTSSGAITCPAPAATTRSSAAADPTPSSATAATTVSTVARATTASTEETAATGSIVALAVTPCSESRATAPEVARSSAERSRALDSITLDGARQHMTQRNSGNGNDHGSNSGGRRRTGGWPIDDPQHKRSGGPHSGARTPREEQLSAWLSAYGRAWEQRDPAAVASLFTADASYEISPSPFPQPLRGRQAILDYWLAATSSDKRVSFDHELLAMAKATGIVRWWATVDEDGQASRLEGFYVVRLARDGRCVSLREWWMPASGSRANSSTSSAALPAPSLPSAHRASSRARSR